MLVMLLIFSVMKSLFEVAAGLSLVIFLSQTYCALPIKDISGITALKSLVTIGILYIIFNFFNILYKELKKYQSKLEGKNEKKEEVVISTMFLVFVCLFIWEIYLVVNPIIMNLCVYK